MKNLALKISAAAATFTISLAIVWIINSAYSAFEKRYPIPEVSLTPITKPTYEPRPVMEYQPLYWPRVEDARLAIPGRALNHDPVTRGYEKWLGLYKSASGYEVREASVKVSSFKEHFPEKDLMLEKRRVQTAGRGEPLFVFKGIDAIKPGKVVTVFVDLLPTDAAERDWVYTCKAPKLTLNGVNYSIFAKDFLVHNGICYDGKAFISDGVTQQMINDPEENDGFNMAYDDSILIWAGDLDSDGKLDLVIELGTSPCTYYHSQHVLLLSSYARPGELVAPVATYENFED